MSKAKAAAVTPEPEESESISASEKALILASIAEKYGQLTAELVVREADPSNKDGIAHRLSKCVGWNTDDATAATRWRTDQARAVIRSVEPELIQLGVFQIAAPFYVRDPTRAPGEQGYVRLLSIKSNEEVAADALDAEIRRAVSALERAYSVAVALTREEDASMIFGALAALGRAPAGIPAAGEGASAQVET